MDTIPGVAVVAGVLQSTFGLGEDLARVAAAALIVLATLAVASVAALQVLDGGDSPAGGGRRGGAKGAVGKAAASTGTPTVVLIGPSGAGKTALLHRMCTGNLPRTVTSLAVASASATLTAIPEGGGPDGQEESSANVRVVDVPGNPRAEGRDGAAALLRGPDTRLVVVVVDASSKPSVREGAKELAELLTSRGFVDAGKRVAVVGTRGEARGSLDAASLRRAVEAELDNVRRSTGTLGSVAAEEEGDADADADDRLVLGSAKETFTLAEHSPLSDEIDFAVVSCSEETGSRAAQRAMCRLVVGAVGGE